jgi:protein-L-isoaspartate O-methyltransferase
MLGAEQERVSVSSSKPSDPGGEVVGVEISPNLAAIANKRIEQEGWNNIHVVVGPAQTIALPGTFDGLLLFAAHEVLTSPEALDHLLAHLKRRVASWRSGPNCQTRDEAD